MSNFSSSSQEIRFEVRAKCLARDTPKFGVVDMVWCGRTRLQADKALARLSKELRGAWEGFHIYDRRDARA